MKCNISNINKTKLTNILDQNPIKAALRRTKPKRPSTSDLNGKSILIRSSMPRSTEDQPKKQSILVRSSMPRSTDDKPKKQSILVRSSMPIKTSERQNKMKINYSDQEVLKGEKSIFLAGPTPRGDNVKSWRKYACKYLEENGFDGIVYVPEYSTLKPRGDYVDQAQWEREALSNASIIAFWVPRELPDMPAFTTNVEFGYWIHSGKILYGRPDNAKKIKYLDWLYMTDTNQEPYSNIEDLLNNSIELANQRGINKENEILPLVKRLIMRRKKH